MQTIVFAGLLVLFGFSLAVGIKLLLLARRNRSFPELALGSYFLVGGGIGYPLSGAAPLSGAWEPVLATTSAVLTSSATTMLYAFTARVFHPGRATGRVGLAAGALLCALYAVGYSTVQLTATSEAEVVRGTMTWGGLSLAMSAGAFAWSSFESLRQYVRHRRRQALGLADPVVTNRMLLWGLMGATLLAIVLIDGVLLYSGSRFARDMVIPLVTSAGGLVFGGLLLLAFFPPTLYLEAVRRRASSARGVA